MPVLWNGPVDSKVPDSMVLFWSRTAGLERFAWLPGETGAPAVEAPATDGTVAPAIDGVAVMDFRSWDDDDVLLTLGEALVLLENSKQLANFIANWFNYHITYSWQRKWDIYKLSNINN